MLLRRYGSPRAALAEFYHEPAMAMTRNAAVIGIGFAPLVLSSLVPYVIVGLLLASIIGLSWLASIVLLPALAVGSDPERRVMEDQPRSAEPEGRAEAQLSTSAPGPV